MWKSEDYVSGDRTDSDARVETIARGAKVAGSAPYIISVSVLKSGGVYILPLKALV
jgi:hypothetical protein